MSLMVDERRDRLAPIARASGGAFEPIDVPMASSQLESHELCPKGGLVKYKPVRGFVRTTRASETCAYSTVKRAFHCGYSFRFSKPG